MCETATLNDITTKIAREARRLLGDKLDKVILYGSYARGDYDEESDIDIMVLADIPAQDVWDVTESIGELSCELGYTHNILVSLCVKDCATFYKYLHAQPFYMNVLKDGVELIA
jgi:predicted nucleotidyltransferase